jgi:hypothetical protein
MTLGVFGQVHDEANNGGGQGAAAYHARFENRVRIEARELVLRVGQALIDQV